MVIGDTVRELGECIYESQCPGNDLILGSHGVFLQPEDISDRVSLIECANVYHEKTKEAKKRKIEYFRRL